MIKKIFALVMVLSVVGGILGGCQPKEETTPEAGATTPAAGAETK